MGAPRCRCLLVPERGVDDLAGAYRVNDGAPALGRVHSSSPESFARCLESTSTPVFRATRLHRRKRAVSKWTPHLRSSQPVRRPGTICTAVGSDTSRSLCHGPDDSTSGEVRNRASCFDEWRACRQRFPTSLRDCQSRYRRSSTLTLPSSSPRSVSMFAYA